MSNLIERLRDLANSPIGGIRTSEDMLVDQAADALETKDRELAEARELLRKSDPLEHCATGCDACRKTSEEIKSFLARN